MATTIYITSTERFAGKTALSVGLMRRFRRRGLVVGYMKPVSTTPRAQEGRIVDEDALFVRSVLDLSDPVEAMAPVLLTLDEVKAAVEGADPRRFEAMVAEAYRVTSKDKDVLILEGGSSLREGRIINLQALRVAEIAGARVLVVVPYVDTMKVVDDLLGAREVLGASMLGAIVNSVFPHRMTYAEEKLARFLEGLGVPVYASLPREKLLLSVSIRELLQGLGGEILCCQEALDELVETLMVGAMNVESALTHFRRASNKAVITGGDRIDIQLAALETSTRCLILTGDLHPGPLIIGLAADRHVPVILTHHDTLGAIQTIENFFGRTRFHQQKKVEYFDGLLDRWMKFDAFCHDLGLTP